MAEQYARIFNSDLFTFTVGAQKKRIVVHSEAVSRLSPSLNKLMHGPMQEAHSSECTLVDIKADDFVRFCQFAYMGDYIPPEPIELSSSLAEDKNAEYISQQEQDRTTNGHGQPMLWENDVLEPIPFRSVDEPPPPPPDDFEDTWYAKTDKKMKKKMPDELSFKSRVQSKTVKLRRAFESRDYRGNRTRDTLVSLCQPVGKDSPGKDFTPVLLGHARLYSLGDKYGIEGLTSLALQKLHKTLVLFHLYDRRVEDILQLVRYIYKNTHGYSEDPLRVLVSEYVVGSIDVVGKSANFHSLLEEGGEFVADFWRLT